MASIFAFMAIILAFTAPVLAEPLNTETMKALIANFNDQCVKREQTDPDEIALARKLKLGPEKILQYCGCFSGGLAGAIDTNEIAYMTANGKMSPSTDAKAAVINQSCVEVFFH